LLESVVPLPLLPARSATPVLSRVFTLLVSVMPDVGVNVAVQVTPPYALLTALKVPLLTVKSALLNPFTASEKVITTAELPPTPRAGFATTRVAVGRRVSTA